MSSFADGVLWQPLMNFCLAQQYSLSSSMLLVGLVCGVFFFSGLRLGRKLLQYLPHSNASYSDMLIEDVASSLDVSGSVAMFVHTDPTFSESPFHGTFALDHKTTPAVAMTRAGMSTATGFMMMRTLRSFIWFSLDASLSYVYGHTRKSDVSGVDS